MQVYIVDTSLCLRLNLNNFVSVLMSIDLRVMFNNTIKNKMFYLKSNSNQSV